MRYGNTSKPDGLLSRTARRAAALELWTGDPRSARRKGGLKPIVPLMRVDHEMKLGTPLKRRTPT